MKRWLRFVVWVFVFLATAPAVAQDTPFTAQSGSRPLVRPDGTYAFNSVPNSKLVFEAQIAPRIIIIDSIGDATRRLLQATDNAPVWGWQASATPMVKTPDVPGKHPIRSERLPTCQREPSK